MENSYQPSFINYFIRPVVKRDRVLILLSMAFVVNFPFLLAVKFLCDIIDGWPALRMESPGLSSTLTAMTIVCCSVFLSFCPLSVTWVRALLRMYPIRIDDTAHRFMGALLIGSVMSCIGGYYSIWCRNSFIAVLSLVVLMVLLRVHRRHQAEYTQRHCAGFILFLRAFNSPNDEAIVRSMFNAKQENRPIMIVIDPRDDNRHFDPFTVCLAGISIFRRRNPIPLYVSIKEYRWDIYVRGLIEDASCIVVDASCSTDGITRELDLIADLAADKKVVYLLPKEPDIAENALFSSLNCTSSPRRIVRYCTSWKDSTFKLIGGFTVSLLVICDLFFRWSALLFSEQFHRALFSRILEPAFTPVSIYICVRMVVSLLRKDLTRHSRHELSMAIHGILQPPHTQGVETALGRSS